MINILLIAVGFHIKCWSLFEIIDILHIFWISLRFGLLPVQFAINWWAVCHFWYCFSCWWLFFVWIVSIKRLILFFIISFLRFVNFLIAFLWWVEFLALAWVTPIIWLFFIIEIRPRPHYFKGSFFTYFFWLIQTVMHIVDIYPLRWNLITEKYVFKYILVFIGFVIINLTLLI